MMTAIQKKKQNYLFTRKDLQILKKLKEDSLCTTSLCSSIKCQHKLGKPCLDRLENLGLIKKVNNGRKVNWQLNQDKKHEIEVLIKIFSEE